MVQVALPPPGENSSTEDDWRTQFFQPRRLALIACLSALPVLLPWLWRQRPDLSTRDEYRVGFEQIVLDPPPALPVPEALIEQARRRADLAETWSALDPQLTKTLAVAFAGHPWIETVHEVRNDWPRPIVVKVTYRQPIARVSVKTGFYAIDRHGVLLPPQDFTTAALEALPPVMGITTVPAGGAGHSWDDPAVLAAAELAEFLRPRWEAWSLRAIVAPRLESADTTADELSFALETTTGSRILWGRPPSTQHPGELTAAQKAGRLQKYLAEFGRFDRPSGPYEIDIRRWQEIARRPLDPTVQFATQPRENKRR